MSSVTETKGTPLGHAARCSGETSRPRATMTSGRNVPNHGDRLVEGIHARDGEAKLREDHLTHMAGLIVLVGHEDERCKAGLVVRAAAAAREFPPVGAEALFRSYSHTPILRRKVPNAYVKCFRSFPAQPCPHNTTSSR